MPRFFALGVLVAVVVGCASVTRHERFVSLYFLTDPLDRGMQEIIEAVEVISPSAKVQNQAQMPADWMATVLRMNGARSGLLLTCKGQQFAASDIHTFDGLIQIHDNSAGIVDVQVKLTVTRGYFGPGRVIVLRRRDLLLK